MTVSATLDHLILKVNDLDASLQFYTQIMGFAAEGTDGPFTVLRVSPDCLLQLAPWGTAGFEHYAFAVEQADFDAILARVRAAELDFGPDFHSVGDNTGPGRENGAHGEASALYINDPSKHLIEIRCYDTH